VIGAYEYAWSAGFFLWQALVTTFEVIVVAVADFALRVVKEAIDVERVAAVFD